MRGLFWENTPDGHTQTHNTSFLPYWQLNGKNGDHEWFRMTSAFILCDLLWKVLKSHEANREGSFKGLTDLKVISTTCSITWCMYIALLEWSPDLHRLPYVNRASRYIFIFTLVWVFSSQEAHPNTLLYWLICWWPPTTSNR